MVSFSSLVTISSIASATIVLSTVAGNEMLWLEPSARNSNLLPVNANGDVRLRSPACLGSAGSVFTPSPSRPPDLLVLAAPAFSIWSNTSDS